jgi:hypothetical protein
MIDEGNKNNEAEAMTVHALYIIGPDHKLRLSVHAVPSLNWQEC